MRNAFISTLGLLAERDRRIVLLTGDLGFGFVETFARRFADRFINVGVAEQNLIGIATGLAESGYLPFAYSIASFLTLRPYESIRVGPILHGLPIRLVGVGGGAEYGHQGLTHYALEDIGIMRLQPSMMVIAPADFRQARSALLETWNAPGPIYYRLGKDEVAEVPGLDGRFEAGRVQTVRSGRELVFLAAGAIAGAAVDAAELLETDGVFPAVAIVSTLNPPPGELASLLEQFSLVITVEAHYTVGGLGSLVSELVAEHGLSCRVVRRGFTRTPTGTSGTAEFLYRAQGLTSARLREAALVALGRPLFNRQTT